MLKRRQNPFRARKKKQRPHRDCWVLTGTAQRPRTETVAERRRKPETVEKVREGAQLEHLFLTSSTVSVFRLRFATVSVRGLCTVSVKTQQSLRGLCFSYTL